MPPEGLSEQLELLARMTSPAPVPSQLAGEASLARRPVAMPLGSVAVPAGLACRPEQEYQRREPQSGLWQGHHCLLLLCFQPL